MLKVGDWVRFTHWMEGFGEFEGEITEIYTCSDGETYASIMITPEQQYSPNIKRCKKVE